MDYFAECGSFKSVHQDEVVAEGAVEEALGLGFVKLSRGLGRKRIVISCAPGNLSCSSDQGFGVPLKRQRSQRLSPDFDRSRLESLPQDVLIRILCFVDHDDLRQLFMVSKYIREASVVAKQGHFAYTTPRKVPAFRNPLNWDNSGEFNDIEPPNAPLRPFRKQAIRKNLGDVAAALFPGAET
ncbi:hypothetical protein MLD38_016767 [Melastoma candidum]|uniref:Uncharacterized protein n=1 Tax=Melastoma candidum TaxID=119954 RepID=A0ACB9QP17_9MYRT|nr:hypothetical protein MLD38_016767 [Melastoma candidum]